MTRQQFLGLGLDDAAIAYRVKIGRLHRVFRGVYSVGRPPGSPEDWAAAAVLACGPGAALSYSSAMTLWAYWRHLDRPYEVTVVGDRRTRGITVHRSTTLRRHARDPRGSRTESRVDDLVGTDGVLGLLGLPERGVVDTRRHRVDEPPLQDRAPDRAHLILGVRIQIEAKPLACGAVATAT